MRLVSHHAIWAGNPGSPTQVFLCVQTLEEALEKMGRYNMLPKTSKAGDDVGAHSIVPPKYVKREVVKGALAPVGRFRGPLPVRTNASTLSLYGAGLSTFADWQVGAGPCAHSLVSP